MSTFVEYWNGTTWIKLGEVQAGTVDAVTGFVTGSDPVAGILTTFRGPTCLLTNIPAGGDVDIGGFRVKNMQDVPDDGLDAASAAFVMGLLNDEVCVVWP